MKNSNQKHVFPNMGILEVVVPSLFLIWILHRVIDNGEVVVVVVVEFVASKDKEEVCWVFVLASLLLKQISIFDVRYDVPTWFDISARCWIQCSNILARFSVPCFYA